MESNTKEDILMRKGIPNRETPLKSLNLVKENAEVIFHVSEDGVVTVDKNEEPRLNVLAVTGPYSDNRWDFEEALLMEVGFGTTRPYNEVHIPLDLRREGEPQNFVPRFKGFQMSDVQYQAVAPYIFEYLENRAQAQVAQRRDGWKAYKIKALGHKNSGDKLKKPIVTKRGRPFAVNLKYEKPPLVRFSASWHDQNFVKDLYWAEIYGNLAVQSQFKSMSSEMRMFLDRALRRYKNTPSSWLKSSDFATARHILDRFSLAWGDEVRDRSYLQKILLRDFLDEKHYFFDELCTAIKWQGEPIEEELLAKSVLDKPESRLGKAQLKIWRRKSDLVLFDLYPEKPKGDQEIIPF